MFFFSLNKFLISTLHRRLKGIRIAIDNMLELFKEMKFLAVSSYMFFFKSYFKIPLGISYATRGQLTNLLEASDFHSLVVFGLVPTFK